MMNIKSLMLCLTLATLLLLVACSPSDGDHPGHEYMPDMGHSIAYEANLYDYYYYNTWGTESDYYKLAQPRTPVKGTVPRGYSGIRPGASAAHNAGVMNMLSGKDTPNSISVPVNGSAPYHFGDNDAERNRAIAELINNPFPITEKGLAVGKDLYEINCAICHGSKGDGNGWLVDETNLNAKYPAQPRNFLDEEWTAKSNGAFYHSIMYGKGVMGSYADKLSYEERWQVIHWVRALQAKANKAVYSEAENTLNNIDVPGSMIAKPVLASDHSDSGHNDHGSEHNDDHGSEDHGADGHGHSDGENHDADHGHGDHH